jgi:hypothetical protein
MKKLLAAMFVALLMVGCGEEAVSSGMEDGLHTEYHDNDPTPPTNVVKKPILSTNDRLGVLNAETRLGPSSRVEASDR